MLAVAVSLLLAVASPTRTTTAAADPVDVNHAPEAELVALPGIGPAIAARIVQARAQRPFASARDFARRVRGIGPKTLARLGDRIVISPPRAAPEAGAPPRTTRTRTPQPARPPPSPTPTPPPTPTPTPSPSPSRPDARRAVPAPERPIHATNSFDFKPTTDPPTPQG